SERLLRRAIALDPKNFAAHHDLGRLLVKLKRYEEALPLLERGVELNANDPGIHYQLFTAYSRLKRKTDADRELAIFKRFEEARKHDPTPLGGDNNAASNSDEGDRAAPAPLPASVAGEGVKPPHE
ncbi:MAG TPA: tetratricopeptide repeat protein, partial [Pyrinomonadaceae bacterium]|nr:tetratricopeptide repeat protein [Pyrinomonadaceae bacterium]